MTRKSEFVEFIKQLRMYFDDLSLGVLHLSRNDNHALFCGMVRGCNEVAEMAITDSVYDYERRQQFEQVKRQFEDSEKFKRGLVWISDFLFKLYFVTFDNKNRENRNL